MKKVNKNLIFYFAMAMALAVAGITSILARSSLLSLVMVLLGVDLMINGLVQLVRFFLAKMRPQRRFQRADPRLSEHERLSIPHLVSGDPDVAHGRPVRRVYAAVWHGLPHPMVAVSPGRGEGPLLDVFDDDRVLCRRAASSCFHPA